MKNPFMDFHSVPSKKEKSRSERVVRGKEKPDPIKITVYSDYI